MTSGTSVTSSVSSASVSSAISVTPVTFAAASVNSVAYLFILFIYILNPKSYGRARVWKAPSWPMLASRPSVGTTDLCSSGHFCTTYVPVITALHLHLSVLRSFIRRIC